MEDKVKWRAWALTTSHQTKAKADSMWAIHGKYARCQACSGHEQHAVLKRCLGLSSMRHNGVGHEDQGDGMQITLEVCLCNCQ